MVEKPITVMTPVFNRPELLSKLYISLVNQNCKDFYWLIVDDGSDEITKNTIKDIQSENSLCIEVIEQENSGKYTAHNTGVKNCRTELFVCVDSDDELFPNAIEKILDFWQNCGKTADICGIVSPKSMSGKSYFKNPPKESSLMDLYNKGQLVGETMLVFRTEVLKKYLFPEIKGEKFMSECVIYNQIDKKYKLAVLNEYLYKAEYQSDGLTLNIEKIHDKNPVTTLIMFRSEAAFNNNFIKSAKSFGAYLAWKKVKSLKSYDKYPVKICVRIAGTFLKPHYELLFKRKETEK